MRRMSLLSRMILLGTLILMAAAPAAFAAQKFVEFTVPTCQ